VAVPVAVAVIVVVVGVLSDVTAVVVVLVVTVPAHDDGVARVVDARRGGEGERRQRNGRNEAEQQNGAVHVRESRTSTTLMNAPSYGPLQSP